MLSHCVLAAVESRNSIYFLLCATSKYIHKSLVFALYIQAREGQKFQQQHRVEPIAPAPTDDPNRHWNRLQIPFYSVFWWSKTINAESTRLHDLSDRSHDGLSSMDIFGRWPGLWIPENYGSRLQRVDFIFGDILKMALGGHLCGEEQREIHMETQWGYFGIWIARRPSSSTNVKSWRRMRKNE